MNEIPPLKDRAKTKLSTTGNSRFAFLRGYELGARENIILLLKLCMEDIDVEYNGIITIPDLTKKAEQVLK